jgi:hypothetical protein
MDSWDDFKLAFNVDDILRGQGAIPEVIRARKPTLVSASERALVEGSSLIHPIALVQQSLVKKHLHDRILLDGSGKLTGTLVVSHLAGAQWISAILVTLGSELEQASARLFDSDPILALALDGLGNAAVENIAQQVCRRVGDKAQIDRMTVSTPLSPGEPGWPVEVGQPEIHSLVDAARIGVQITAGGMMVPKKSISFVLGIGRDMSQEEPCTICSLRESCHYHG